MAIDTLRIVTNNNFDTLRIDVKRGLPGADGDADLALEINAATAKTTPDDADLFAGTDSAAGFGLKNFSWTNIKATLKAYFDGLYPTIGDLSTLNFTVDTVGDTAGNAIALATDNADNHAAHIGNLANPHLTTKTHVGLGNVDNIASSEMSLYGALDRLAVVKSPADYITTSVTMDTGATTNELIHPTAIYTPKPFGPDNHRYFMLVTPYPDLIEARENPSLLTSQHGREFWTEPTGINPLDTPDAGEHLADTHLVWSEGKLHCVWISTLPVGGNEIRYCTISHNEGDVAYTVSDISVIIPTGAYVSPSLDRTPNERWKLWYVDITGGTSALYKLTRQISDDVLTGWEAAVAVDLNGLPAGYRPWHAEVKKFDGIYYGTFLCQPVFKDDGTNTGYGEDTELFFGSSESGNDFEVSRMPILNPYRDYDEANKYNNKQTYKCSFIPYTTGGNKLGRMYISDISLYTGADASPHIAYADVELINPALPTPDHHLRGKYSGVNTTGPTDDANQVSWFDPAGNLTTASPSSPPSMISDGLKFNTGEVVAWVSGTAVAGNTYAGVITLGELPTADYAMMFRFHSIGIGLRPRGFCLLAAVSGGATYAYSASTDRPVAGGKYVFVISDRVDAEVSMLINNRITHHSYGNVYAPGANVVMSINSTFGPTPNQNLNDFTVHEMMRWEREMPDDEMRGIHAHLALTHNVST